MPKQDNQPTSPTLQALVKSEYLATSILSHEPTATPRLEEYSRRLTPPVAEGEQPLPIPDWRGQQMTHHGNLQQADDQVSGADLFFINARADFRAGVEEGKVRTRDCQDLYRDVVRNVESAHGKEWLYLFGLNAPPARGQVAARQQLSQVAQRMNDPSRLALVPATKPGRLPLDIAGIRSGILDFLADFEVFLEAQRARKKALQEASFLRNQAIKDHRRVYVNIARVLEGWYRLAGLDELADRLRTFARGRKPKLVTEPDPSTAPDPGGTDPAKDPGPPVDPGPPAASL